MNNFELAFEGGAMARYFPRYRRCHPTIESAEAECNLVYQRLHAEGLPTACHRFEICDKDGRAVRHT